MKKIAVSELTDYIQKMTGVRIPVGQKCPEGMLPVWLGKSGPDLAGAKLPADAGPDAFIMSISNDGIILRGKGAEGTLNAVYEFLNACGVRWFMPGKIGEVIPVKAALSLKVNSVLIVPDFRYRGPWSRVAIP